MIGKSSVASHGIYGAPELFQNLLEAGETCTKHRVELLMRENNLRAAHSYRTPRERFRHPFPTYLSASSRSIDRMRRG